MNWFQAVPVTSQRLRLKIDLMTDRIETLAAKVCWLLMLLEFDERIPCKQLITEATSPNAANQQVLRDCSAPRKHPLPCLALRRHEISYIAFQLHPSPMQAALQGGNVES